MKVYIIGISGMLGSQLFKKFMLMDKFKVRGSSRKLPKDFKKFKRNIDLNHDIEDLDLVNKKIKKFRPNVVINCVGVIKQKIYKSIDHKYIFYVNSVFPHELYKITQLVNARLIHFSTDCVYDGRKGNYKEIDKPNSRDLYGLSKILGELNYPNSITLRTSIIGHEIKNKLGLFEWFMSQKKNCQGFANCYFSGFPTNEIFNIILKIINKKNLSGIYNLSSYKISKYNLLKLIAKIYKKKIKVYKNSNIKIDRSLNSKRLKNLIKYKSPSWEKLILEMYKNHGKN